MHIHVQRFFSFFLLVEPEKYISGLEVVSWCAMTYQGEATNAQLCLRLIKIPHVHPSAIYLTAKYNFIAHIPLCV